VIHFHQACSAGRMSLVPLGALNKIGLLVLARISVRMHQVKKGNPLPGGRGQGEDERLISIPLF
jgi:hypothetical protein